MKRILSTASWFLIFSLLLAGAAAATNPEIRTERVKFAKGTISATIKGQLKGYETIDYLVRAGAGQTMSVKIKRTNLSNYFNILPPGNTEESMNFAGTEEIYKGILPIEGDYRIRVYLMRSAARRNEKSQYTLTIAVTGKALAPIPSSRDATIPNTPYHASTTITCVPYIEKYGAKRSQECEAFVIRREGEGNATVVIPQANGFVRRILFLKGKPVASDSPYPTVFSRKKDLYIVTFDTDERYEVPDMLVFGG